VGADDAGLDPRHLVACKVELHGVVAVPLEDSVAHDQAFRPAPSLAPEHDWAAASKLVRPALRPTGTAGSDGRDLRLPTGSNPGKPIVAPGPAGLSIVYVIPGSGFDVVVGVDHLLAWGVGVDQVHAAALSNLQLWSDGAGWEDETNGSRRVTWSDAGDGLDAARILLPQVRERLLSVLEPARRVLVGLPERDLLIAAALADEDADFAAMFASYVADRARTADDPIEGRVFELVDGELAEFRPEFP
jgi:hypothetical protein